MRPVSSICLVALIGMVAQSADPPIVTVPQINTVDPPALVIGRKTRVQIVGKQLGMVTDLLLPFPAQCRRDPGGEESTRFDVTPHESVQPGVYPLRVYGSQGISNLRLICVGREAVIHTQADGNGRYRGGRIDLDSALPITWPSRVAGGRLNQDVDLFRFRVKAGQRLVFSTETRQLGLTPDPVIRLRDARGRTLALVHDTPTLRQDERLDYTFAQAGEYFVELQSFGVAGWTNHYVLKIGPYQFARTVYPLGGRRGEKIEVSILGRDRKTTIRRARVPDDPVLDRWRLALPDHPGSLSWPMASGSFPERHEQLLKKNQSGEIPVAAWPVTINGRIGTSGEEDRFQLVVKPGQVIRAQVAAWYLGSALDGLLLAYDPVGKKLLAQGDDLRYRGNMDPGLEFTVPPGVTRVVVALRDTLDRGGPEYPYRLTIETGGADFFLWMGERQNPFFNAGWSKTDIADTVSIPRGGESRVKFTARRNLKGKPAEDGYYKGPVRGYAGPIQLRVSGLPKGVTAEAGEIGEGQIHGEIIFRAETSASRQPFSVAVTGVGLRRDGTVLRRVAERMLFLSDPQQTHLPWQWRSRRLVGVVMPAMRVKP